MFSIETVRELRCHSHKRSRQGAILTAASLPISNFRNHSSHSPPPFMGSDPIGREIPLPDPFHPGLLRISGYYFDHFCFKRLKFPRISTKNIHLCFSCGQFSDNNHCCWRDESESAKVLHTKQLNVIRRIFCRQMFRTHSRRILMILVSPISLILQCFRDSDNRSGSRRFSSHFARSSSNISMYASVSTIFPLFNRIIHKNIHKNRANEFTNEF